MEPGTIIAAMKIAKEATDMALKLKKEFFDKRAEGKLGLTQPPTPEKSIEELRNELDSQREVIGKLAAQIEQNREIIEKQNELIISVSAALQVTANAAKNARYWAWGALGVATLASAVLMYVATR